MRITGAFLLLLSFFASSTEVHSNSYCDFLSDPSFCDVTSSNYSLRHKVGNGLPVYMCIVDPLSDRPIGITTLESVDSFFRKVKRKRNLTQVEEKALALKYVPFTVRDGGGFEYLPDLFRGQNSIDSNLWVRLCGFFSQGALFCQRISPILEQVLAFFIPATKVSFDQEEEI